AQLAFGFVDLEGRGRRGERTELAHEGESGAPQDVHVLDEQPRQVDFQARRQLDRDGEAVLVAARGVEREQEAPDAKLRSRRRAHSSFSARTAAANDLALSTKRARRCSTRAFTVPSGKLPSPFLSPAGTPVRISIP